jgi:hypothetical protein
MHWLSLIFSTPNLTGLLRACRQGPHRRRAAAEKRNELVPSQLIEQHPTPTNQDLEFRISD